MLVTNNILKITMNSLVKKPNKRVSLNESQFTILVHGGVVSVEGIDITLQDIGYNRMEEILNTTNQNTNQNRLFFPG